MSNRRCFWMGSGFCVDKDWIHGEWAHDPQKRNFTCSGWLRRTNESYFYNFQGGIVAWQGGTGRCRTPVSEKGDGRQGGQAGFISVFLSFLKGHTAVGDMCRRRKIASGRMDTVQDWAKSRSLGIPFVLPMESILFFRRQAFAGGNGFMKYTFRKNTWLMKKRPFIERMASIMDGMNQT